MHSVYIGGAWTEGSMNIRHKSDAGTRAYWLVTKFGCATSHKSVAVANANLFVHV